MGLLQLSEQFRQQLLNLNLPTPTEDVQNYLNAFGLNTYANYQDDLGSQPVINWYQSVIDAGSISDHTIYLQNLLNKNKQPDNSDPSDTGGNSIPQSIFNNYLDDIGSPISLTTYNVPNQDNVADVAIQYRNDLLARNKQIDPTDPNDTGGNGLTIPSNVYNNYLDDLGDEPNINDYNVPNQPHLTTLVDDFISVDRNRYRPVDLNYAQVLVNELTNKTSLPYTHEGTSGFIQENNFTNLFDNENYEPSSFLQIDERVTIPRILLNGERVLENDTLLMNIAATQLKFLLESRVNNNLEKETLGKLNIFNATNPITAINILKDPLNNFFIKNWDITTGLNPLQDLGRFAATLAGVEIPVSPFENKSEVLTPKCFDTTIDSTGERSGLTNFFRDFTGRSLEDNHSDYLLSRTGAGQKSQLYGNLKYNKYAPDYKPVYDSQFFNGLDGLKEKINDVAGFLGLGAGTRPLGKYYIGLKRDGGPISLLSDNDGDQVRPLSDLTKAFVINPDGEDFFESKIGQYGSQTGDLIWGLGTEEDIIDSRLFEQNPEAISLMSGSKVFRECSILDKTHRLMAKGGMLDVINQTKNTFKYGDYVFSKGSAAREIEVTTNSLGKKNYRVTDNFCRTWTKTNPYTRIKDLVRYKELLRKERNSVLDANGNLNIAPTDLNVKKIPTSDLYRNDDRTDGFDELRARKYMFSIENLAWKDDDMFKQLPPAEKGPNGGRVMWFPPYDIEFDENSSANWSTHNFLGRPEPIYTYNNTERVGNLSFKIVVDHPTILNILVQKEFANISDSDVDDVINSFWAGCLEFDIFELARIWGVYSTGELEYFKSIINSLPKDESNQVLRNTNIVSETTGPADEPKAVIDIDDNTLVNLIKSKAYFPHSSGLTPTPYGEIIQEFENEIYTPTNVLGYDNTLKRISVDELFLRGEYNNLVKTIKDFVSSQEGNEREITINIETSLSPYESISDTLLNGEFGKNRFLSFVLSIVNQLNPAVSLSFDQYLQIGSIVFDIDKPSTYVQFDTESGTIIKFTNTVRHTTVSDMLKGATTYEQYNNLIPTTSAYTCTLADFTTNGNSVCTIYSLPASESRYVKVKSAKVVAAAEDKNQNRTITEQNRVDVTKREIAQRLLSKLITEGDYFKVLKEDSPFIFQTLREKLQYFSPAFHSTTPEGLNGRLNFLQQCLRPGMTIKNTDGTSCDANNTSFGKPPVCVLRIGDFFHTKMIIRNLQITYDKIWDMNPEGIGMQPMIANVNMTVAYFGGHGLRKPVERLQNALSFDYYANSEVHDERAFANTDNFERNLINQERDFFNNNQLDLVDITRDEIADISPISPTSTETIGEFISSEAIEVGDNSILSTFGDNGYIDTIDFNYKNTFKSLYQNYTEYVNRYIDYQRTILDTGERSSLLANQIFFNKNDFKLVTNTTNNTNGISDVEDRITALKNLKDYTQVGLQDKILNQLSGGNFSIQEIKLHLYPQKDLQSLSSGSDGLTGYTIGGNSPIPIDNFTGIVLPKPPQINISEGTNFFGYTKSFEDKIDAGLLSTLTQDFTTGVNIKGGFEKLLPEQKNLVLSSIKNKFIQYKQEIAAANETYVIELTNLYKKLLIDLQKIAAITSGVDGIYDNDEYYEIIPNAIEVSGPLSASNFFQYEPYYQIYAIAISSEYTDNTGTDVNIENIIKQSTRDNAISGLIDNLMEGNLDYLKRQLDGSSPFVSYKLPQFDFSNHTWSINGGQIIDLTGGTSTIESDYSMLYNFEKINYEVFNFGQRTVQNLTKDDTLLGNRTEIQDVVVEEIRFKTSPNLDDLSTLVTEYDKVYGYLMFGDKNNKTKLNSIQFSPDNVSSKYPDIYNRLLDFVTIEKTISKSEYEYIKNNIDPTVDPTVEGARFSTKSIEELIFMDFLVSLTEQSFVNDLKSSLDNIKFTRQDIRTSNTKKRTAKRNAEEFVNDFIGNISGLITYVNKDYDKLRRLFKIRLDNYESFVDDVNSTILQKHNGNNDYTLRYRKTDSPNIYGKTQLERYKYINRE